MNAGYLSFIGQHARFLGFGFGMALLSSFGQTFYISLFGAEIRADFDLSHGGFGAVYSFANILSAASLVWLGRLIDRVDLRLYSAAVLIGLALGCAGMSLAPGIVALWASIYLLRLFGQGLASHTAMTSMARYFSANRGKAMSIASLGVPGGEALLPIAGVAAAAAIGWRETWAIAGTFLVVAGLPAVLWSLRAQSARHEAWLAERRELRSRATGDGDDWSQRDLLRDPYFYALLPLMLASSYIVTGLFFHQAHLASTKGWALSWLATCFVGYAAASLVASLIVGPLIDRAGAIRLLPLLLVPSVVGLIVLASSSHPATAVVYMCALGLGSGAQYIIGGALWAELYGVTHLGAIRSVTTAFGILAAALAPATMGWLIDAGVSMEAIAWGSVAWCGGATALILRVRAELIRRAHERRENG